MRVAATQFGVTNDVEANLATCLRMIRQAAAHKPDLIVMPEFCNHNSWYDDANHCYQVSVDIDGEFLSAIADAAREAQAIIVINCTVRRPDNKVTGTSLMYSADGELIGETNKQVLIGHENDFLERASSPGPIIDTEFGQLAMYSCMDGVINETPRCLALRGAQLLCNSLNSFAIDEGNLHIPVRAAENKVFVVAANKVAPLIPEAMLAPVSEGINIPIEFLSGAGDSQIVAPNGEVLAMAGKDEEVIWADIDLGLADDKARPDGTDIYAARRKELYSVLAEDPEGQPIPVIEGPESVQVSAVSIAGNGKEAVENAVEQVIAAQQSGSQLICLPELLWRSEDIDITEDLALSDRLLNRLSSVLDESVLVATTIISSHPKGIAHQAVMVGKHGIVHEQIQVHNSHRFMQCHTDNRFGVYESEFGKIAVITEDDAIYPETFRLLAMQGCHSVLVPLNCQEPWLVHTGLTERSAENRVNIIAADKHTANNHICKLQSDFTLMTPWKDRQFDGLLSAPEVHRDANTSILSETINPLAAENKVCSHRTHLIASRPWQLLDAMVK